MIQIKIRGDLHAEAFDHEDIIPRLNSALNVARVPDTASRRQWVDEVSEDLRQWNLHPFTCFGPVSVHDSLSPATHAEWLANNREAVR